MQSILILLDMKKVANFRRKNAHASRTQDLFEVIYMFIRSY